MVSKSNINDRITINIRDQNVEIREEQSSFLNNNNSDDGSKNKIKIFTFKYLRYLFKSLRFILFYYIDTVKDIFLIFYLYEKKEINSAIATSIIILLPTLFMIVIFIWKELYSTDSLCKKFVRSVYYILIFSTRFHIII